MIGFAAQQGDLVILQTLEFFENEDEKLRLPEENESQMEALSWAATLLGSNKHPPPSR